MHLRSKYEVSHKAGEEEGVSFHLLSPPQHSWAVPCSQQPHTHTYFDLRHLKELQRTTGICSQQPLPVWGWLWRASVCWLWREVRTLELTFILSLSHLAESSLSKYYILKAISFCLMGNTNDFVFLPTGLIPLAPVGPGIEKVEFSGVMPGFIQMCANKRFLNPASLTCKYKSYWGSLLLPDWQVTENDNKIWKISFFIPAI